MLVGKCIKLYIIFVYNYGLGEDRPQGLLSLRSVLRGNTVLGRFVIPQRVAMSEKTSTSVTAEWLLACVNLHMPHHTLFIVCRMQPKTIEISYKLNRRKYELYSPAKWISFCAKITGGKIAKFANVFLICLSSEQKFVVDKWSHGQSRRCAFVCGLFAWNRCGYCVSNWLHIHWE